MKEIGPIPRKLRFFRSGHPRYYNNMSHILVTSRKKVLLSKKTADGSRRPERSAQNTDIFLIKPVFEKILKF